MEDIVLEDPSLPSGGQVSDSCDNDFSVGQTNVNNKEHMPDACTAEGTSSVIDSVSTDDPTVTDDISEQITTSLVDLHVMEDARGIEPNVPNVSEPHLVSVEGVDMLLDKCLLQALHTTVKDKDLPIPGSMLW